MENNLFQVNDYKKLIGINIKRAIEDKGYTQTSFAKEMDMPTSQINRYCLGKTSPSSDIFNNIAKQLDLSTAGLLYYTKNVDRAGTMLDDSVESDINAGDNFDFDLKSEIQFEFKTIIDNIDFLLNHLHNKKAESILNKIKNKLNFIRESIGL